MRILAILVAAVWTFGAAAAARGDHYPHLHCPACNKVCRPEVSPGKDKKHCWDVECKDICIPAIRFPWTKCCEPLTCGKVITVRSLKKVEYECDACHYKWSVEDAPACAACAAGQAPAPTPWTAPPAPAKAKAPGFPWLPTLWPVGKE